MEESDRYDTSDVHKVFQQATELWQKSACFCEYPPALTLQ